jgi:hypothetical protein
MLLLTLLATIRALACDPEPIPQIHPAPEAATKLPATVAFALEGTTLHVRFEVKTTSIYGLPKLAPPKYPYMFDVAEVFVSAEGGVPYYEFEITPNNQTFNVRISYKAVNPPPPAGTEPPKVFQNGVDVGSTHEAQILPPLTPADKGVRKTITGWTADLHIPLDRIGWKGDPKQITGNAFVILGQNPNKVYFSRSLPVQDRPNFHLPANFKPLLCDPPAATSKAAAPRKTQG